MITLIPFQQNPMKRSKDPEFQRRKRERWETMDVCYNMSKANDACVSPALFFTKTQSGRNKRRPRSIEKDKKMGHNVCMLQHWEAQCC